MAILNVGSSGPYYEISAATLAAAPGDTISVLTPTASGALYGIASILVDNLTVNAAVDVDIIQLGLATGVVQITGTGPSSFFVYGNGANNLITTGDADDLLMGAGGDDTLNGGGGDDIASYQYDPAAVNINLATGTGSDGYGGTDTLVSIEALLGSQFDDTLTGDSNDNYFLGLGGNDIINGGGGIDTVSYEFVDGIRGGVIVNLAQGSATDGFGGFDTLASIEIVIGSDFIDHIVGDANDNTLSGGASNDFLDGGDGFDTASYEFAQASVVVSLASGTASDGYGTTDTLRNIEAVTGSIFADQITGDSGINRLEGLFGADHLDGAGGDDLVDYSRSFAGVTVNLESGVASDGFGFTDTLVNIESVTGSNFDDTLTGDSSENTFAGLSGDDAINGGGGEDVVVYALARANYTISFNPDSNTYTVIDNTGAEGTDTLASVEFVNFGSSDAVFAIADIAIDPRDETFVGDALDNTFTPLDGNDTVDGAGGDDTVNYSASPSATSVNLSTGAVSDGYGGADTLTNVERVIGSAYADTLTGSSADNQFTGGGGNDTISGAGGNDRAIYALAASDYTVTFNSATGAYTVAAKGGAEGTDTLTGIEFLAFNGGADVVAIPNALPNAGDDTLVGDAQNNVFAPGAGTDSVDGKGGTDTVDYTNSLASINVNLTNGQGADGFGSTDTLVSIERVIGSAHGDTITGSGADETFIGNAGDDVIDGAGGFNTASYENSTSGIQANLATGVVADGVGGTDTLSNIQVILGSAYDDEIVGGSDFVHIKPGLGSDIITAGSGGARLSYADLSGFSITIVVSNGSATAGLNDISTTFTGVTEFEGSVGGAFFFDAPGSQTYVGISSTDRIDFGNASGPLVYNISSASVTVTEVDGSINTLIGIEQIAGHRSHANTVNVHDFESGINSISAQSGKDLISFATVAEGILVDRAGARLTSDAGTTIAFSSFVEGVVGTAFDDTFLAFNFGPGYFYGGAGNDTFGSEPLSNAHAIVSYRYDPAGVSVDLTVGQATDGFGDRDTLNRVYSLEGSEFGDVLVGNSTNNTFRGRGGDDLIDGSYQTTIGDTAQYALAQDQYLVVYNADTEAFTVTALSGDEGVDTLLNIEWLRFGDGVARVSIWQAAGLPDPDPNILIGDGRDNFFSPGVGDQTIYGRGGVDVVSYSGAPAGVTVDLGAGTADDGQGGSDTLDSVEGAIGSIHADVLTGSDTDNIFYTNWIFAGGDVISGLGGTDTLSFQGSSVGISINRTSGRAEKITDPSIYDSFTGIENFLGSRENDEFHDQAGSNVYDGGDGSDRAVYALAQDQYIVSYNSTSNSYSVKSLSGGAGTDTLTNVEILSFNGGTTDVAIADAVTPDTTSDFDGDGDDDIVFSLTASGNSVTNSADGAGGGWIGYADRTVIGTGDFNGDGDADLLFRFADGNHSGFDSGGAGPWLGRSDRTAVAVGDFNGDGDDDVLFQFANGNKHIADADSGNTWVGFADRSVEGVGDFDGDGDDDVLFELNAGGYVTNNVDGTGGRWLGGPDRDVAGIGDFDGDGDDDILFVLNSGGHIINDGEGGGMQWFGFTDRSVAGIGDFDGDGNDDILFRLADGNHTIISPNGVGRWIARTNNTVRDVGDYDGDGDDDILFEAPGGGFVVDQADGGVGLGMYFLDRTLVAGDPLGIGLTSDADLV
ncbi:calcium-binding protein [Pyruvatibacter sp.]|uniref:beta strand repeat-containing protein n=1 Tax=Pyruvatibacter sp. TaxID=1981328 RepID=UPI0032653EDA